MKEYIDVARDGTWYWSLFWPGEHGYGSMRDAKGGFPTEEAAKADLAQLTAKRSTVLASV